MRTRDRVSGRAPSRVALSLLRAYAGFGGPLVAVGLFLGGAGVWWALGCLVPWFLIAGMVRRLERG